jgi:ribonuclease HII
MKWVIGVDEVGRGPLAGPVTVGVCAMPIALNDWKYWEGLRDSKKLSEKQREEWYARIKRDDRVQFRVAHSTVAVINKKGIVHAIRAAATKAAAALELAPSDAGIMADRGILVSGDWHQEQFTKGDEKIPAIAIASIMAKVTRDRAMVRLAKKYPNYGFEEHKGYGTKAHQQAIRERGPLLDVHRDLFIRGVLNRRTG